MKYVLTENETIAILGFAEKALTFVGSRMRERDRMRMTDALTAALDRLGDRDQKDAADDLADAHTDDEDNDDAGDEGDAPPLAPNVTPFRVAPPVEPEAPSATATEAALKAEQEHVKALHGKDVWIALIELWRRGFMDENAPQPDRVTNLNAAMSPSVMSYIRSKAGVTDATREAIYLLDGGDPGIGYRAAMTPAQIRESRLIAENIAQVASFHAPWFTEQLEYSYDFRTIPKES